ncbi:glucosaminidase domain-containing protein [Salinicoccus sp. RF5]|uniref:glucosaminidase domain-containing protein n=1 Tax=Salinicoccus sp. RF5 TaxID=2748874 RepID=UPI001E443303|nr:glucosaminidase domain-containing protein [Salinicoccus sp. RF5]MCC4722390.1 glucosaminidase domain-containing protein [Salinicoccus sp. RF5]
MKYKNRLIVPTLISTALFGTALNVEAEEMVKDEKATYSETTLEVSNAEVDDAEKEHYIEPKNGEPVKEEVPLEEIKTEDLSNDAGDNLENSLEEGTPQEDEGSLAKEPPNEPSTEPIETNAESPSDIDQANALEDEGEMGQTLSDEENKSTSDTSEAPDGTVLKETENVEPENGIEDSSVEETEEVHENEQPSSNQTNEYVDEELDRSEDSQSSEAVNAVEQGDTRESEEEELRKPKNDDSQNNGEDETSETGPELSTSDNADISEESKEENDNELISEDDVNSGESNENDEDVDKANVMKLEPTSLFSLMSAQKIDAASPVYTEASYAAKIASAINSGLYSPVTSKKGVNADFLLDKTIYVERKASYGGETFYRVHSSYEGAMQGWMRKNDLKLWKLSEETKNSQQYKLSRNNGGLLTDPWGTEKQYVKTLDSYKSNAIFKAEKTVKLGALTFYYGKLGQDYGWIQDTKVEEVKSPPVYSDARFAAKIDSAKNSGLYSPVTSKKGVNSDFLLNKTIYIEREANYGGETFYRVHSSYEGPMQGWMKKHDLKIWNLSTETNNTQKYDLTNHKGGLLTDPWGTKEQYVKALDRYSEDEAFQAEKTLKLGALTFHYGKLGTDYGWIQDTKVTPVQPSTPSPVINEVKYGISLDEAVDIQMGLRSKPQAWASGGGWRDATRSEVEYYLNPANHRTDVWDYTYLDLNRAQNISTVELNNKLLANKGILHNQGTAFLQAANTHGVNEVYLISHALHETGNGQSTLAQGVRLDENGNISKNGKLYYNMYGIAAYDHNPVLEGARYAQRMGWDTPAKAVIGGAQFISSGYFNRGQNTLYAMRWNPANPGTYQYATDVNWAYATARNLKNYYDQLGIRGQYYTRYTF